MLAVKTFDSTGIAPNGRVYAADLNAIQAAAAGLTDLTQNISAASLTLGESGLTFSRFGTGEMQIAGAFRSTGILRGIGGVYPGQFTTTTRNAIGTGLAPQGLIIFNTTTGQFEWNSGSDASRVWKALGYDPAGDVLLSGGASSLDFTDQTALNYFLTVKRTADTVTRFAVREDGQHEWGPGGSSARDVILYRGSADTLQTDDALSVARTLFSAYGLGSNSVAFQTLVTGDGLARFLIRNNGPLEWGSGAGSPDTNLFRAAAQVLATDGWLRSGSGVSSPSGGQSGIGISNIGVAISGTPTGGGWLYAQNGQLLWRDSNGNSGQVAYSQYGVGFPASPVDGMIFTLVDSVTNPTWQWQFRYNVSNSTAYKWEFIGGTPATIVTEPQEQTSSTSYVDLSTIGPQFTIPRTGVYRITIFSTHTSDTGGAIQYSALSIGGGAPTDAEAAVTSVGDSPRVLTARRQLLDKTLSASTTLKMQYRVQAAGGSPFFTNRTIIVQPMRLS